MVFLNSPCPHRGKRPKHEIYGQTCEMSRYAMGQQELYTMGGQPPAGSPRGGTMGARRHVLRAGTAIRQRGTRPPRLLTITHRDGIKSNAGGRAGRGGEKKTRGEQNSETRCPNKGRDTREGQTLLSLPLSLSLSVHLFLGSLRTGGEEEADTLVGQETLAHGEALLVIAAVDAEDVALPLLAERVGGDLGRDALVEERAERLLVLDEHRLLRPVGRVRDVELDG
jgi:hypothetical protein